MTYIWAVHGPDPNVESHDPPTVILEVFKTQNEAESFLGSVIMSSATMVVQSVEAGGTFSLLLTRGLEGMEMTGGFALHNPSYKNRSEYYIKRWEIVEGNDG